MHRNPEPAKLALSIPEFCDAVGIGRSRAYEEIKSGRLRVLKCGRRTLIAKDAVQQWLGHLATQSQER